MATASIPSDLVPYVYSYLVSLNLQKSAKALKKESSVCVQAPNGPGLVQFYEQFMKSQSGKRPLTSQDDTTLPPAKKRKAEKLKTKNKVVPPQDSGSESDDELDVTKGLNKKSKKNKSKTADKKLKKKTKAPPKDSSSDSSSSSESDMDTNETTKPSKEVVKSNAKSSQSKIVTKSSSSDSSSSDSESETRPPSKKPIKKVTPTKKKQMSSSESSSSSDDSDSKQTQTKKSSKKAQIAKDSTSSSSSSEDEEATKKKSKEAKSAPKTVKVNGTQKKETVNDDESSSSSSLVSSDSETEKAKAVKTSSKKTNSSVAVTKLPAVKVTNGNGKSSESSESSEESSSDEVGTNKSTPKAIINTPKDNTKQKTPATFPIQKKKSKKGDLGVATPFRRVKEETEVDPRLQDNSFEAKAGAKGSWGERANKDLKFTKGRSFRHEKTKKKRGSYKGGAIDMQVYSIKFDNDD